MSKASSSAAPRIDGHDADTTSNLASNVASDSTISDEVLLSCLVDGELDDAQRERALQRLTQETHLQRHWALMHVVRDALRSRDTAGVHRDEFHERVLMRVAQEPSIVAPRWSRERLLHRWAVPGLAVAAATAVLSVVVLQLREPQPALVAVQTEPVPVAQDRPLHPYLQAHREFVPTGGVLPPSTPYLRTSSAAAPHEPQP